MPKEIKIISNFNKFNTSTMYYIEKKTPTAIASIIASIDHLSKFVQIQIFIGYPKCVYPININLTTPYTFARFVTNCK